MDALDRIGALRPGLTRAVSKQLAIQGGQEHLLVLVLSGRKLEAPVALLTQAEMEMVVILYAGIHVTTTINAVMNAVCTLDTLAHIDAPLHSLSGCFEVPPRPVPPSFNGSADVGVGVTTRVGSLRMASR